MKKGMLVSLAAGALLLSAAGYAADTSVSGEALAKCPSPAKPEIPNGRNASEEQMLAAQKAIKTYQAANKQHTDCLASLEQSWGDKATDDQRAIIVILHNRAIDEETGIADLFNQSIRAYKGKSGS